MNLREELNKLDHKCLDENLNFYDLRTMYESIDPKLTAQDKTELKQLLNSTNDPNMVVTFLQTKASEKNEEFETSYAGENVGKATEVLQNEVEEVYPDAYVKIEEIDGKVYAEAEVNGETIFAAEGNVDLLDRIINKEFFWGKENHLFMTENCNAKSLKESCKDDVIDWLSDHKVAYKDALNHFEVDNLEGITEEDIIDWIREHDQLSADFDLFFNKNESLREGLSDDVLNDVEKEIVDDISDRYNTSNPVSGSWDTEAIHERNAIMKALNCDEYKANKIMIDYLGFDSWDLEESCNEDINTTDKSKLKLMFEKLKDQLFEGANADVVTNIKKAFNMVGGNCNTQVKSRSYIVYSGDVKGYTIKGSVSLNSLKGDLTRLAEDLLMGYNVSLGGEREYIPSFIKSVMNENYDENRYQEITSKSVSDYDGFYTDYTMYHDNEEDKYVFIFGDKDVYTPDNSDADWECETEEEAYEWFDDYTGLAEED